MGEVGEKMLSHSPGGRPDRGQVRALDNWRIGYRSCPFAATRGPLDGIVRTTQSGGASPAPCVDDGPWQDDNRAVDTASGDPVALGRRLVRAVGLSSLQTRARPFTPALVLLHLRPAERGHVRTLLLLPDSLSADDFRRLRACLRLLASDRS